jgi:hypothetical protein
MESVKQQYLYFLPIYFPLGSLLQNIWSLAIISTIGLILMCLYSDIYKEFQLKIKNFLYYLWGCWIVVLLISISKYYGRFDNIYVYFSLFFVLIFLLYFFNKMGKVLSAQ